MYDIGMSPNYRNGVAEDGECDACRRIGDLGLLEPCTECGRIVCPRCSESNDFGCTTCHDCVES